MPDSIEIDLLLTKMEADIYDVLERAGGRYVTVTHLVNALWDGYSAQGPRTHIGHMRKKLEGTRWRIESRPGRGYRLVEKAT